MTADAVRGQVGAARDLLSRALEAAPVAAVGLLDLAACELAAAREGARMAALGWLREAAREAAPEPENP